MAATTLGGDIEKFDDDLFRRHFDRLPGPAYIWQRTALDFVLVAHNRAAAHVEHTRIASLIGMTATELHAERPDIIADLNRCIDDDTVVTRESLFRYTSNDLRRLIATNVPIGRDSVVTHIEDVTERRAAERALAESEARTRALFNSNPDVTFRLDPACRIIDLHVAATTPFPFEREALLGRRITELYSGGHADEHRRLVAAALDTGETQVWEFGTTINGCEVYLEARFVRSGDEEVVVSVRDVSERFKLERSLIEIGEHERSRIGQDLHDGLAQILTGVKLLVSSLKERLRAEGSAFAPAAAQAADLIDASIQQARELAQGLSPIGKGDSLAHALEQLARQSSTFFSVACRAICVRTPKLDETLSTHLYRIAQEAITNAVRHGRATLIEVTCDIDRDRLVLRIRDNGVGIPDPLPRSEGLGLRIMRHRATSIDGDLRLARDAAGGTIVTCSCALPESNAYR